MFNFKILEEDDGGFTAELRVDDFVYTIFWSSWAVLACSGDQYEAIPLEAIYFDPV